nr:proline-rich receptor-like protein kinase PERK8 [Aegilops tauschii subsp. strangulata]
MHLVQNQPPPANAQPPLHFCSRPPAPVRPPATLPAVAPPPSGAAMADADDPAAFSAATAAGGLIHVAAAAAVAAISPATAAMPPPPARRPGLAPPRPVATAQAAKGRGGSVKRPPNRSRNPVDSSTRPAKVSKAAAAARGDDSQTVRPAASWSSHTSIPQPPPPPPPAVEEDVATPTATASNMFDEMSQSVDDEAFMHATNVANDDYIYES